VERLSGLRIVTRNGERLSTPYVILVKRLASAQHDPAARHWFDIELSAFPPAIEPGITVTLVLEDGRRSTVYRSEDGYSSVGGFCEGGDRMRSARR
jgi:hypothetical protein